MVESKNVGFKELDRIKGTLPSSVPKEIVSFANTSGGVLHIGTGDDGSIVGGENPDDVMTRLSNTAKNLIFQMSCRSFRLSRSRWKERRW